MPSPPRPRRPRRFRRRVNPATVTAPQLRLSGRPPPPPQLQPPLCHAGWLRLHRARHSRRVRSLARLARPHAAPPSTATRYARVCQLQCPPSPRCPHPCAFSVHQPPHSLWRPRWGPCAALPAELTFWLGGHARLQRTGLNDTRGANAGLSLALVAALCVLTRWWSSQKSRSRSWITFSATSSDTKR